MADGLTQTPHNFDEVYTRLYDQGREIGDIAKGQAATEAKIEGLEDKFDDGFARITRSINVLADTVNRPPEPTNWVGIISAFATTVIVLGGFVVLHTSPLQKQLDLQYESINGTLSALASRGELIGEHNKMIEWHQTWLTFIESQLDVERARNADIEERVSRMEGRQEMLVDRVKDIDDKGSRRWNGEVPK